MNPEEKNFFEEIKDRCRLSFEVRGKMAILQEKKYLDNESKFTLEKIKALISDWIISRKEFTKLKEPIKFDMKKLLLDREEIKVYMQAKEKEIYKTFKAEGTLDTYSYLFVTHRDDGMVVTVGKSSRTEVSFGDLFYELNTNRLSGTENIILRTQFGNEIFKKYDKSLKNYLDTAWVIPVESENAKELERLLGNELIDAEVPILNYYSHRY